MMRFLAENRMAVRVGSTVVLGVSVLVYGFLFFLLAVVPPEPEAISGTNTPLGNTARTATVTKTPTPLRSPTPFSTLGPTPGQFGGSNPGGGGTGPVILPPTRVIPIDTAAPTFTQDIRDDDQDGILNVSDTCPNRSGPSANGGCPIDSDGDGLLDDEDNCAYQAGPRGNSGCAIPQVIDSDADTIPDDTDDCDFEAGPGSNRGCPIDDTDGDTVPDGVDDCIDVPGTLNGCPDSDGDGVRDNLDACPQANGTAANGCPDTDGDGLTDDVDACDDSQGPANTNGCPVQAPVEPAPVDGAQLPSSYEAQTLVLGRITGVRS